MYVVIFINAMKIEKCFWKSVQMPVFLVLKTLTLV